MEIGTDQGLIFMWQISLGQVLGTGIVIACVMAAFGVISKKYADALNRIGALEAEVAALQRQLASLLVLLMEAGITVEPHLESLLSASSEDCK